MRPGLPRLSPSDTVLNNRIFTNVGSDGAFKAGAFVLGLAAIDAGDRIIYSSTSGALYYDPDGTGSYGQIQFATLATGLGLSASDFLIV